MPIDDQQPAIRAVSTIEQIQEQTRALDHGVQQVREALLDSVQTGIALTPDQSYEIDDNDDGEAN